jgi:hypothetical protein
MQEKINPAYPYGPGANALTIIRQWRETSTPQRVDEAYLAKLGLSSNLNNLNVALLTFLGLIDAGGKVTARAADLVRAHSDQYPAVLAGIIREAYAPIFEVCDPATAPRRRVEDAFRGATPHAQRDRMATLFLALCKEGGIGPTSSPRGRPDGSKTNRATRNLPAPTRQRRVSMPIAASPIASAPSFIEGSLHPSLLGVLALLHNITTIEEFDTWAATLRAVFVMSRPANR